MGDHIYVFHLLILIYLNQTFFLNYDLIIFSSSYERQELFPLRHNLLYDVQIHPMEHCIFSQEQTDYDVQKYYLMYVIILMYQLLGFEMFLNYISYMPFPKKKHQILHYVLPLVSLQTIQ